MRTLRNTDIVLSTDPDKRRRHRSRQERRAVVEETFRPGASVAVIARAHGVNANQVFHWRKLYHEGRLDVKSASTQLVPVRVHDVVEGRPQQSAGTAGVINIEFARARIRVQGKADVETLRVILEQLDR